MSEPNTQINHKGNGCLMQICATDTEQYNHNVHASTLVRYTLKHDHPSSLHCTDNEHIFNAKDHRVKLYTTKLTHNVTDAIVIKYLTFEKYDNLPFNMDVIIVIGGKYFTSVSNEFLDTESVKIIHQDENMTKYRIELPFSKMFQEKTYGTKLYTRSIFNNEIEITLRTTNNVTNVQLICEHIYYYDRPEKTLSINTIYPSYNYGMSNSKIDISRVGYCMGYYIHCRKPIKHIKMIIWDRVRHDLDAELIDLMCQRVNTYTIYMPISPGVSRYSNDFSKSFCQPRVDKLEFEITVENNVTVPVCIIAECINVYYIEKGVGDYKYRMLDNQKQILYTPPDYPFIRIPRELPSGETDADNTCVISYEPIGLGMEYSKCPQCIAVYLYEPMHTWWSSHKSCPHCKIRMAKLPKYINAKPGPDNTEQTDCEYWELPGPVI